MIKVLSGFLIEIPNSQMPNDFLIRSSCIVPHGLFPFIDFLKLNCIVWIISRMKGSAISVHKLHLLRNRWSWRVWTAVSHGCKSMIGVRDGCRRWH